MKRKTFESQRPFARQKVESMQRRCLDHDYTARQMYMLTMVTEGRHPWFGQVTGLSNAEPGTPDFPHIELSPLGKAVEDNFLSISTRYPQIDVIQLQMMPDHLHAIIFVKDSLPQSLGKVILGFKHGCNKDFHRLLPQAAAQASLSRNSPYVAVPQQQTKQEKDNRHQGLLFARNYNDRILFRPGQLEVWRHYLTDNPRRLLLKREHPDLFRVQRGILIAGRQYSAIGNLFLAHRPHRLQVQCSRSLTDEQIQDLQQQFLSAARQGAVLVSPCISKGEKTIMRAAFTEGFPLICLQENGFTDLAKPGGTRMEACARGQLLLLAPWQHHNEKITITRSQCLTLNDMAREICKQE